MVVLQDILENIFTLRIAVVQVALDVLRVLLVGFVLQEHIIRQITHLMGVSLVQ